jgi:ABC-2 type transport system permease protein
MILFGAGGKEHDKHILRVGSRELKRIVSNPLYLFGMIVLPLLSFFIFWAIFFRGVPQELPVAVCDSDRTALSRKLVRMLDASSTINIAFSVNDLETAQKYIREGKVYAVVVFQKDLERDAYTGKAPLVVSYYNNDFLLLGSLINRSIRNVIATASAQISLPFIQGKGASTLAAPVVLDPIKVDAHQLFNPYLNYTYFSRQRFSTDDAANIHTCHDHLCTGD